MEENIILQLLKTDLQICADGYDEYLKSLIGLSRAAMEREGIVLDCSSAEDGILTEMYAAYLFRKRREETAAMPRSLRYALNNRLISQKGGTDE